MNHNSAPKTSNERKFVAFFLRPKMSKTMSEKSYEKTTHNMFVEAYIAASFSVTGGRRGELMTYVKYLQTVMYGS